MSPAIAGAAVTVAAAAAGFSLRFDLDFFFFLFFPATDHTSSRSVTVTSKRESGSWRINADEGSRCGKGQVLNSLELGGASVGSIVRRPRVGISGLRASVLLGGSRE